MKKNFEKLYIDAMNELAQSRTENDQLKMKMSLCKKCKTEDDKEKSEVKKSIKKEKKTTVENQVQNLQIENDKLKTKLGKVDQFFFLMDNKNKNNDNNVFDCPYCDIPMEPFDNRMLCKKCGAVDECYSSEQLEKREPPKRTTCHYDKLRYFLTFLRKLDDTSSFPLQKLKPLINQLFPQKSLFTSIYTIRQVLYETQQTKKLLRYSVEIFYYLNDIKLCSFSQKELQFMTELYQMVLNTEKTKKIRLSQSKTYFAKAFITEFFPEKLEKLSLILLNKRLSNKKEYDLCLKNIFASNIVNLWRTKNS